ncbi:adenosylcobinamide-phosphate synthase CbiB [uncultured Aquimarina sp.]|uniref:adenosylcobinamide-phosphate synthase CbiB n=1 Tax=uncultured Aquimarina sp. TaxID=575652 RepID=UPI002633D4C9|nr:adenosylcobinamide-phosphate synthase CbiB [uncultured Aquimarina sp.]
MELNTIYILIAAFLIDLIIGDPRSIPHLIVGYGYLIAFGEKKWNHPKFQFLKGVLLTISLVIAAFSIPYFAINYCNKNDWVIIKLILSTILLFYCLANKTLVTEGKSVFKILKNKGLEEGRKRLSWIVGRDTTNLNAQQIRIATLETMSENLSDGVIAPLFYFACLGVPGAMAYKMINTLDSMVGYRNEKYEFFGKFAANLDDVVNFIPSRITALLMLLVTFKLKGISFVFYEGKKHSSPNAGYPEAALAYILSCKFGGPNFYKGKLLDKPFIGTNDRLIRHEEIFKVARINYRTSFLAVIIILLIIYWLQC